MMHRVTKVPLVVLMMVHVQKPSISLQKKIDVKACLAKLWQVEAITAASKAA